MSHLQVYKISEEYKTYRPSVLPPQLLKLFLSINLYKIHNLEHTIIEELHFEQDHQRRWSCSPIINCISHKLLDILALLGSTAIDSISFSTPCKTTNCVVFFL